MAFMTHRKQLELGNATKKETVFVKHLYPSKSQFLKNVTLTNDLDFGSKEKV